MAAAMMLVIGGCAAPRGGQDERGRVAGHAPLGAIASAASLPMLERGVALPNEVPPSLAAPGRQVVPAASPDGWIPSLSPPNANRPNQVAQVGHVVPARIMAAAGCGGCGACNACGAGDRAPAPWGCVVPTPQGWNAHGIDPQEFLCDGGDQGPVATLRRDDSIAGLGLEDTVVHYTTEAGNIHFQPSNRVCVYAPRFTSVRKITGAVAGGRAIGLGGVDRPVGPIRVEHNLPGLVVTDSTELGHADVARRVDAMRDRNRGVPVDGILQPEQTADVMAVLASLKLADLGVLRDNELALIERLSLAAVTWTTDESLEVAIEDMKPPTLTRDQRVEGVTVYDFPDAGRLQIVKLADRSDALPGEIVSFAIRIDNVGDSAVNNVVLSDNLTTRLEYVPDSQTCEGAEAQFTAVANEGQSAKLVWKISDELKVGDSITIRFDCKVR